MRKKGEKRTKRNVEIKGGILFLGTVLTMIAICGIIDKLLAIYR